MTRRFLSGSVLGTSGATLFGGAHVSGSIPSATKTHLLRQALPKKQIPCCHSVPGKAPFTTLRECFSRYAADEANAHPNSEATLLPSPSIPPSPAVDDPAEARWRTPSKSDGTPIPLPRRFVSTP
jgi:hypothetical protein